MTAILEIGLSNALVATVLAGLAAGVSWRIRSRPALVHGLWLLVFIKLLTPPVVSIPVRGFASPEPPVVEADTDTELFACPIQADVSRGSPAREPAVFLGMTATPEEAAVPVTGDEPGTDAWDWSVVLSVVWGAGSVVLLARNGWRAVALWRLLKRLPAAPEAWQMRVDGLARRLGLWHAPQVRLTEAALPPLVVALGRRATLLVPSGLWQRLDEDQRDVVLLHELAHLRRGDHRVRLVELLAQTLYWWFPVVWLAGRPLRQAEEECCDAWVVWAEPAARPRYAAALVETVAFLSGQPALLPVGASGAGPVVALKRRLSMILEGKTPRGLSRVGWLIVLGGVSLLPLVPALAQTPSPRESAATRSETPQRRTIDEVLKTRACSSCHQVETPRSKQKQPQRAASELHDRIVALMADLDRQRAAMLRTETQLKKLIEEFDRSQARKAEEKPRTPHPDRQQQLEDKLERLMHEIEGLKREIRSTRPRGEDKRKEKQEELPVESVYYVNQRSIQIPFQSDRNNVQKITGFVRRDKATKWEKLEAQATSKGAFTYTADNDGMYEFALQVIQDGKLTPRSEEQFTAMLTVVVDTAAPVLRGKVTDMPGWFGLNWAVEDAHLSSTPIVGEYRVAGDQRWQPLSLKDSRVEIGKNEMVGSLSQKTEKPVAEVKLRATDRAGNVTETIFKPTGKSKTP